MNKALLSIAAVAAVAVAVPAVAQPHYGPGHRGPAYENSYRGWAPMAVRARELERKIDFAHSRRAMSTGKARDFRRDINNLVAREARYGRNATPSQRLDLERRYQRIDQSIERYVQSARRRR